MARHVIGVIVGSVALATSLSGCLLPIDAAKPGMSFTNDSSQDVVVIIEGMNVKFERLVLSGSSYPQSLPECSGTGIRVETESGEVLGRIDKQACPNWTLTINKDDSLNYGEDK
jgi:hypothetical protein